MKTEQASAMTLAAGGTINDYDYTGIITYNYDSNSWSKPLDKLFSVLPKEITNYIEDRIIVQGGYKRVTDGYNDYWGKKAGKLSIYVYTNYIKISGTYVISNDFPMDPKLNNMSFTFRVRIEDNGYKFIEVPERDLSQHVVDAPALLDKNRPNVPEAPIGFQKIEFSESAKKFLFPNNEEKIIDVSVSVDESSIPNFEGTTEYSLYQYFSENDVRKIEGPQTNNIFKDIRVHKNDAFYVKAKKKGNEKFIYDGKEYSIKESNGISDYIIIYNNTPKENNTSVKLSDYIDYKDKPLTIEFSKFRLSDDRIKAIEEDKDATNYTITIASDKTESNTNELTVSGYDLLNNKVKIENFLRAPKGALGQHIKLRIASKNNWILISNQKDEKAYIKNEYIGDDLTSTIYLINSDVTTYGNIRLVSSKDVGSELFNISIGSEIFENKSLPFSTEVASGRHEISIKNVSKKYEDIVGYTSIEYNRTTEVTANFEEKPISKNVTFNFSSSNYSLPNSFKYKLINIDDPQKTKEYDGSTSSTINLPFGNYNMEINHLDENRQIIFSYKNNEDVPFVIQDGGPDNFNIKINSEKMKGSARITFSGKIYPGTEFNAVVTKDGKEIKIEKNNLEINSNHFIIKNLEYGTYKNINITGYNKEKGIEYSFSKKIDSFTILNEIEEAGDLGEIVSKAKLSNVKINIDDKYKKVTKKNITLEIDDKVQEGVSDFPFNTELEYGNHKIMVKFIDTNNGNICSTSSPHLLKIDDLNYNDNMETNVSLSESLIKFNVDLIVPSEEINKIDADTKFNFILKKNSSVSKKIENIQLTDYDSSNKSFKINDLEYGIWTIDVKDISGSSSKHDYVIEKSKGIQIKCDVSLEKIEEPIICNMNTIEPKPTLKIIDKAATIIFNSNTISNLNEIREADKNNKGKFNISLKKGEVVKDIKNWDGEKEVTILIENTNLGEYDVYIEYIGKSCNYKLIPSAKLMVSSGCVYKKSYTLNKIGLSNVIIDLNVADGGEPKGRFTVILTNKERTYSKETGGWWDGGKKVEIEGVVHGVYKLSVSYKHGDDEWLKYSCEEREVSIDDSSKDIKVDLKKTDLFQIKVDMGKLPEEILNSGKKIELSIKNSTMSELAGKYDGKSKEFITDRIELDPGNKLYSISISSKVDDALFKPKDDIKPVEAKAGKTTVVSTSLVGRRDVDINVISNSDINPAKFILTNIKDNKKFETTAKIVSLETNKVIIKDVELGTYNLECLGEGNKKVTVKGADKSIEVATKKPQTPINISISSESMLNLKLKNQEVLYDDDDALLKIDVINEAGEAAYTKQIKISEFKKSNCTFENVKYGNYSLDISSEKKGYGPLKKHIVNVSSEKSTQYEVELEREEVFKLKVIASEVKKSVSIPDSSTLKVVLRDEDTGKKYKEFTKEWSELMNGSTTIEKIKVGKYSLEISGEYSETEGFTKKYIVNGKSEPITIKESTYSEVPSLQVTVNNNDESELGKAKIKLSGDSLSNLSKEDIFKLDIKKDSKSISGYPVDKKYDDFSNGLTIPLEDGTYNFSVSCVKNNINYSGSYEAAITKPNTTEININCASQASTSINTDITFNGLDDEYFSGDELIIECRPEKGELKTISKKLENSSKSNNKIKIDGLVADENYTIEVVGEHYYGTYEYNENKEKITINLKHTCSLVTISTKDGTGPSEPIKNFKYYFNVIDGEGGTNKEITGNMSSKGEMIKLGNYNLSMESEDKCWNGNKNNIKLDAKTYLIKNIELKRYETSSINITIKDQYNKPLNTYRVEILYEDTQEEYKKIYEFASVNEQGIINLTKVPSGKIKSINITGERNSSGTYSNKITLADSQTETIEVSISSNKPEEIFFKVESELVDFTENMEGEYNVSFDGDPDFNGKGNIYKAIPEPSVESVKHNGEKTTIKFKKSNEDNSSVYVILYNENYAEVLPANSLVDKEIEIDGILLGNFIYCSLNSDKSKRSIFKTLTIQSNSTTDDEKKSNNDGIISVDKVPKGVYKKFSFSNGKNSGSYTKDLNVSKNILNIGQIRIEGLPPEKYNLVFKINNYDSLMDGEYEITLNKKEEEIKCKGVISSVKDSDPASGILTVTGVAPGEYTSLSIIGNLYKGEVKDPISASGKLENINIEKAIDIISKEPDKYDVSLTVNNYDSAMNGEYSFSLKGDKPFEGTCNIDNGTIILTEIPRGTYTILELNGNKYEGFLNGVEISGESKDISLELALEKKAPTSYLLNITISNYTSEMNGTYNVQMNGTTKFKNTCDINSGTITLTDIPKGTYNSLNIYNDKYKCLSNDTIEASGLEEAIKTSINLEEVQKTLLEAKISGFTSEMIGDYKIKMKGSRNFEGTGKIYNPLKKPTVNSISESADSISILFTSADYGVIVIEDHTGKKVASSSVGEADVGKQLNITSTELVNSKGKECKIYIFNSNDNNIRSEKVSFICSPTNSVAIMSETTEEPGSIGMIYIKDIPNEKYTSMEVLGDKYEGNFNGDIDLSNGGKELNEAISMSKVPPARKLSIKIKGDELPVSNTKFSLKLFENSENEDANEQIEIIFKDENTAIEANGVRAKYKFAQVYTKIEKYEYYSQKKDEIPENGEMVFNIVKKAEGEPEPPLKVKHIKTYTLGKTKGRWSLSVEEKECGKGEVGPYDKDEKWKPDYFKVTKDEGEVTSSPESPEPPQEDITPQEESQPSN